MYLEYLLLIIDYYRTLTLKVLLFEWGIPIVLTVAILYLNFNCDITAYKVFKDNSINILGVLLGFSIAIITIITTGNGENLENIKKKKTKFKIGNKVLTLYDLILINFTYSVIIEIFIIVCSLIMQLISSVIVFNDSVKMTFYSFFVFLVLHIFLLTIMNFTDFYFILTKK